MDDLTLDLFATPPYEAEPPKQDPDKTPEASPEPEHIALTEETNNMTPDHDDLANQLDVLDIDNGMDMGMDLPPLVEDTGHALEETLEPEAGPSAMDTGGDGGDGGGDGIDLPEGDYHPLGEYAEHAYLAYAMSVVKGRAIPDVSDGQKHVQRRILYAMHQLGVTKGAKPVKSARVVGEVLGKWHPHSDQAAYDAMVRLAQDFSMRYPLIDGEGNFGSRDGDSAAAMRYTEARLSGLAELLLSEIDQGTVDFAPNYDGTLMEPKLLPARLPMILLNGQTGIGVGMATETPSHNMREVANAAIEIIKRPEASVTDLMQHIQGPDFPGGGHIISSETELLAAYETGRGSMKVRARWEVEQQARGQWRIIVNELPHGVSANQIIEEIGTLTEPQPKKGEKDVSAQQKQLKALFQNLIEAVRDESNQDSPVRLVIEPRSSRQKPEEFMQAFLSHTSLETNYSMNLVVIGIDGRPTQKNLREILSEWATFRFDTVTRRCQHRLGKVNERIHILEGRQIVLLNIDEVIRIIRESDEPKQALIDAFHLSDRQAEDILEIRLRQLARLEAIKIEQELSDLRRERDELAELLGDPGKMRRLIIKEIKADADKFGDDRRTLIEAAKAASFTQSVANEPVTIILSQKGWIRSRTGHGIDLATLSFKDGDKLLAAVETRTVDPIVLLDESGRAYSLSATQVPGGRGEGVPLATLLDLPSGTKMRYLLSAKPESRYLFSVDTGYAFVAKLSDLVSRLRAGKSFMSVEKGESVNPPVAVPEEAADAEIATLSTDGRLLVFPLAEVRVMAKGRGVRLMMLGDERLRDVALVRDTLKVEGDGRGGKTQVDELSWEALTEYRSRRDRRGRLLSKNLKNPRLVS